MRTPRRPQSSSRRLRSNTADVFEDTRDLLNWQTDFLLRQETDAEFLVQVPAYLQTLREEPRLAIHMQDLDREAAELLSAHEPHDAQMAPGLSRVRDELVQRVPEADDSREAPPSGRVTDVRQWQMTLASFDRVASGELQPGPTSGRGLGRTGWLVEILTAKLESLQHPTQDNFGVLSRSEQNQRPDLDDLALRIGNAARRHEHFVNGVRLAERTSGGLALKRLDALIDTLNPPPALIESPEDIPFHFSDVLCHISSGGHALFLTVYGDPLDRAHTQFVADRVCDLRKDVQRLHDELRRRTGTTASRLALVLRFKHRAEWYDRDRLRGLAEAQGAGTIEDRLTGELVRFLFDQGLSPLTKPMLGSLQPDVFDPSLRPAFYVEAKQYGTNGNPRQTLLRSIAQVHDTAGTMRGDPYGVHEAFVVVFRRGGPRYSLPERLPGDGWTTHLVLVDISPVQESGSRARRQPVNLMVSDFLSDHS
jgi:hypothetical protein